MTRSLRQRLFCTLILISALGNLIFSCSTSPQLDRAADPTTATELSKLALATRTVATPEFAVRTTLPKTWVIKQEGQNILVEAVGKAGSESFELVSGQPADQGNTLATYGVKDVEPSQLTAGEKAWLIYQTQSQNSNITVAVTQHKGQNYYLVLTVPKPQSKVVLKHLWQPALKNFKIQASLNEVASQISVDRSIFPITVPFRLQDNFIVIDVQLNNHDTVYPMILDTGNTVNITPEIAKTFNLEALSATPIQNATGQTATNDVVKFSSVKIGKAEFKNVAATVGFDPSGNNISCVSPNGFIGAMLMKTAVWSLDFEQKKLTISDNLSDLNLRDAKRVRFTSYNPASPSPYAEVFINGQKTPLLFDTGSGGGLQMPEKLFTRTGSSLHSDDLVAIVGHQSEGPVVEIPTHYSTVERFNIGQSLSFANFPIAVGGSYTGFGMKVMGSLKTITFDWLGQNIYLEEPPGGLLTQLRRGGKEFPFGVEWNKGQLQISQLFKDSFATQAGLKIGDILTQVEGVDYTKATFKESCTTNRTIQEYARQQDSIRLQVKRNGQLKEVEVVKENPFLAVEQRIGRSK